MIFFTIPPAIAMETLVIQDGLFSLVNRIQIDQHLSRLPKFALFRGSSIYADFTYRISRPRKAASERRTDSFVSPKDVWVVGKSRDAASRVASAADRHWKSPTG